jgi:hypothetical protein
MKPKKNGPGFLTHRNLFYFAVFPLLLCSCLGINMDIALNQNGSGTITLEYQISKSLDSLGRLDGNERWNTIPVGKADFERTLDRLPGMKLVSHTSREDAKNLIIIAKMEFSSIKGLIAFLDAQGRRVSFTGDANSGRMVFTLNDGTENKNAGLDKLIAGISEGYQVKMSMSFPAEGSLAVSDQRGRPLAGELQAKGKKVSCSFSLYEVLSAANGINAEFSW